MSSVLLIFYRLSSLLHRPFKSTLWDFRGNFTRFNSTAPSRGQRRAEEGRGCLEERPRHREEKTGEQLSEKKPWQL